MRNLLLYILLGLTSLLKAQESNDFYISNQAPLKSQPYVSLPLGYIAPKGMLLKKMLIQYAVVLKLPS